VLLTHEPAQAWAGRAGPLLVISDRVAWQAVAHLSPPVLLLVDGAGRVRRLVLPVREQEVDQVWDQWIGIVRGEMSGADVGGDTGR
jgi:hypothetical protein